MVRQSAPPERKEKADKAARRHREWVDLDELHPDLLRRNAPDEHKLLWASKYSSNTRPDRRSYVLTRAITPLRTTSYPEQRSHEPLWTAFCTGPVLQWHLYLDEPLPPMTRHTIENTIADRGIKATIETEFPPGRGSSFRTGLYGEAAVFAIIVNYLGGTKVCRTFKNRKLVFRTKEDQDPIDLSFFKDGKFVHFCVKCSQENAHTLESSTSFFAIANRDLIQPHPTIVVRWRISHFDWNNPLGGRLTIHYLVHRNFNVDAAEKVDPWGFDV